LENDPEYARAYLGLAETYWTKHFWSEYFSEQFMDSVLILADKALSYDNHLDEAYYIRGLYFTQINKIDRAETEFEKALKYNPNFGRHTVLWQRISILIIKNLILSKDLNIYIKL
jgi:tetratricopeptide (TPR) repeat protein